MARAEGIEKYGRWMMATILRAGYIYASDDGEVVLVGFADSQYDTREYVLLQRAKECSPAERKLGLDKVHIEINDQGRSNYGGIQRVEIAPNRVAIHLDAEAASTLATDRQIEILTSGAKSDSDAWSQGLRALLENEPETLA